MVSRYFIIDPVNDRVVGYVNEDAVKDMLFKGLVKKTTLKTTQGILKPGFEAVRDFNSNTQQLGFCIYRGFLINREDFI